MSSLDDELKATVRRNMLLGMWAAEKPGHADAYAKDFAFAALDAERSDVLSKVAKDFERAGITQSDEQILRVWDTCTLQASAQVLGARGGSLDAAEVALKRKLTGSR
ncbi:MAG: ATPase inhibitor subunit zeta [Alphaproteobacteria bacterium]